jgi:hypothetical protein
MRRYHSLRDHVNFLLHRHLAARDLESGAAGIGAMLPDLWRMADRRVRASPTVSPADTDGPRGHVLAGINHHIQVDRWFHADEVFVEGERLTLASFRNAGVKAPKLGLFAHVTWEMALDGALLRREGLDRTLAILRNDLAGVGGEPLSAAASAHHFDRIERSPGARAAFDDVMSQLFASISDEPWIGGYRTGTGIARRLDGMRNRMGLGRLDADAKVAVAAAIETLTPVADQMLGRILLRWPGPGTRDPGIRTLNPEP